MMKHFAIDDIKKWTQGTWIKATNTSIENFCFDTRKLGHNECFLAIKNEHNDGHNYVKMAEEMGAVAALVEYPIPDSRLPQCVVKNTLKAFQMIAKSYRETLSLPCIALTGSCGKTTSKELLALLLGPKTFKSQENFNNFLGVPYSLTRIDPKLHDQTLLEVGINQPNEMDNLVATLQPDTAILINVEPVHLGNFDCIESIAMEKIKLLNGARKNVFLPEKWKRFYSGNADYFFFAKDQDTTSENAIIYETKMTQTGWALEVNKQLFELPFRLGNKAAETFAMMVGVALKLGRTPAEIQAQLVQWRPSPMRGLWKVFRDHQCFIDCYNANPVSFEDSLQHFYREKPVSMSVAYFIGCMGELGAHSARFHRQIVSYFHPAPTDAIVCIGMFAQILADEFLSRGLAHPDQIHVFEDTTQAKPLIDGLPQSCFYLKGSHCYHLENLVAES